MSLNNMSLFERVSWFAVKKSSSKRRCKLLPLGPAVSILSSQPKTTCDPMKFSLAAVEELNGLKVPDRKGQIRLVKLADKQVAKRGEIVTFTIRFDNIGDRPVGEVVIMDNLTPRMSYVPDTATSNRPGEFSTEDNGAGSLILRWELDEPLAGGEGGVVSFQGRVE